jgi:hypothetical protein
VSNIVVAVVVVAVVREEHCIGFVELLGEGMDGDNNNYYSEYFGYFDYFGWLNCAFEKSRYVFDVLKNIDYFREKGHFGDCVLEVVADDGNSGGDGVVGDVDVAGDVVAVAVAVVAVVAVAAEADNVGNFVHDVQIKID